MFCCVRRSPSKKRLQTKGQETPIDLKMIPKSDPLTEVIEEEDEEEEEEHGMNADDSDESEDEPKKGRMSPLIRPPAPPIQMYSMDYADLADDVERSLALVYVDKWRAYVVSNETMIKKEIRRD